MYQKFISFFKSHQLYDEEMFRYFQNNSLLFDYRMEEYIDFIGCFYAFDKKILKSIKLVVPYIMDDKTILINIHEYIHAILFYQRLGKGCEVGLDREILPMLYEKIYLLENPSQELEKYEQYLNHFIYKNDDIEYIIALELQEELLDLYFKGANMHQLDKKAKRLVKRYYK